MNNDLISREALRNVILNDSKLDGANANWEVNRILVHIDNAPPVPLPDFKAGYKQAIIDGKTNFARPKGEWVVYGKQGDISITDRCTNCNYEMKWYKIKYNFCPNCGADMREIMQND